MRAKIVLAAFCLSVAVLAGCGGEQKKIQPGAASVSAAETGQSETNDEGETNEASRDVFAMDTYMTVTAYGEEAEAAVEEAEMEIYRIENLLSTGISASEIAKVNEAHGGVLSEDGAYLVKRSLELYESTGGVFDISIYPVMKAWGFTDQNYRVPSEQELEKLLKKVDSGGIRLSEDTGEISFSKEGMEIDLGGIAKGYTSARIMEIFRQHGIESGMVSLGGNVQVLGHKTDGSPWRVAIRDPHDEGDYLGVLETADQAVVTSGGYERFFEENGQLYHHIIDPKTGYPADSGLVSVTVVSSDGTLADGLSTSLFIMGKEKAADYWRRHSEEFDAVLMDEDNTLYVTEGIADSFSSDYDMEVIRGNDNE